MRREQRFLVHHRDAVGRRFRWARERNRLAAPQHFAAVALVHASDDLHQRGFARAVFAHQQMDFAFGDFEVAVAQSMHAAKAFLIFL